MLALDRILQAGKYDVYHLHTVFDVEQKRVGLHGVPEHLVERQAESLGLPLKKLYLRADEGHNTYERLLEQYMEELKVEGVGHIMFGDIFLDDLKSYRDGKLGTCGMQGVYPLWKEASALLIEEFLKKGYKTRICAADKKHFNKTQPGKILTREWVASLPPEVDVCGENGEFHSFVYDGPLFKRPVAHKCGGVVQKDYRFTVKNEDGTKRKMKSSFYFLEMF